MNKFSISGKTYSWPAWMMLGAGLLITVFVSLQVKHRTDANAEAQMVFSYGQATLKIQERLNAYALILRGAAGLFAASDTVTRSGWRAYVEKLQPEKTIPGVQGIGFAQIIPPGQLTTHIVNIRQEGFPDYTVRPPGRRAITTAIVYLEPLRDRNLRAFGFDMFSEPVRRAAMEQARDTGTAVLSGKVELVQETDREVQTGTLMYLPVYRNGAAVDTLEQKREALLGWVYSPYRMGDLMSDILRDWEYEDGKAINLHIYDGPQATPDALLFDNQVVLKPDVHLLFRRQQTIDFNGHPWLLVFEHIATAPNIRYAAAWSALCGGLALSGLLFSLMLSIINTARIAEELTEQVRRREKITQADFQYARSLIEASLDSLVAICPQGKITDVNAATEKVTGLDRASLIGSEFAAYFTNPGKAREGCEQVISQGFMTDYPLSIRHVLGKITAVLYNASVYRNAQGEVLGVFAAARDITKQKKAEAELRRTNADLGRLSVVTAHHLMEPSRRLLVYAQRLSSQIRDRQDDEDMHLSLTYIEQSATRLRNLVRDIERYLAADHPRAPLVMHDLAPIIATIKQRFVARLAASNAAINVDDLPPAYLDLPRLTDILEVLLDNALTHCSPGVAPCIWMSGERYAGGTRLRVDDNGPGIPPVYRQRVLELFERLAVDLGPGTGIGLAIVRRIAESREGRIWIETSPQGGTAVLVDLPDSSETH